MICFWETSSRPLGVFWVPLGIQTQVFTGLLFIFGYISPVARSALDLQLPIVIISPKLMICFLETSSRPLGVF